MFCPPKVTISLSLAARYRRVSSLVFTPIRHLLQFAGILLAAALFSLDARADFLQTMATGVYQNVTGHVKVVVSSQPGATGLFVMAGPPINPQEFNLEGTHPGGFTHVFIRFSEELSPPGYSAIEIKGKSYKISGNLTLNLAGFATINIDNNNPYLTIVTEGAAAQGKPDILGFSGTTEVIRGSGNAAAILAANQLDVEVAQIIRPYEVKGDELLLNGKKIVAPAVGTFIRPDSECLKPTSVILTNVQVLQVQSAKTEDERLKILSAALKESQRSSPLKGHLVLKSEKNSVILLSVTDKNIKEMHPIKSASLKKPVCVISDITLG